MLVSVSLIIVSIVLWYCFVAYMTGLPLIFNVLGDSNILFYMMSQLGLKWSFVLGIFGLILGTYGVVSSRKGCLTVKNSILIIVYLIAELITFFAIIV